jgi:hypothetical protein
LVSDCLRYARALPRPLVEEVAAEVGVPCRELADLPRRHLRRIEQEADPRSALVEVASAIRQGAPLPRVVASEAPAKVEEVTEAVRLDLVQIQQLPPLSLLALAARVVWALARAWLRASPYFAGLRQAKSQPGT